MSDPADPAQQSESTSKAIKLLGERPPLPPPVQDSAWTWTPPRLKAVYLEAFTDIQKREIAEMVGVTTQTLFNWRNHGDYKRYMADLVYSDGVAEKVERNKTRKTVADALLKAIMAKLSTPGALAGEKVSAMIKTLNDLLVSIGEDVAAWEKVSEQARAGKPVRQDGSDMAAYIRGIEDPEERETLRKHLLEIFKSQIDRAARAPSHGSATEPIETETVSDATEALGVDPDAEAQADGLSPDALE